jgi:hypothetical protein
MTEADMELLYRLIGWCVACFMAFQWGHARGERVTMEAYNDRLKKWVTAGDADV